MLKNIKLGVDRVVQQMVRYLSFIRFLELYWRFGSKSEWFLVLCGRAAPPVAATAADAAGSIRREVPLTSLTQLQATSEIERERRDANRNRVGVQMKGGVRFERGGAPCVSLQPTSLAPQPTSLQ